MVLLWRFSEDNSVSGVIGGSGENLTRDDRSGEVTDGGARGKCCGSIRNVSHLLIFCIFIS